MTTKQLPFLLCALIVVGCQSTEAAKVASGPSATAGEPGKAVASAPAPSPATPPATAPGTVKPSTAPSTTPDAAKPGPADAKTPPPTPKADAPAPSKPVANGSTPDQISSDLKSEGFYYYSLSNLKPMKMEIRVPADNRVLIGEQTVKLKEIKNGAPVFSIERTGQLDLLGTQELRLDKDGLYNIASTINKVGPHDLEMPAKLTPGVTWPSHIEVDQSNMKMVNDSVFRVVGIEKVKTPVAEREALLITSTGTGVIDGKKVKSSSKSWYVKNLGAVKTVLLTTFPDGKVQEIITQEIK